MKKLFGVLFLVIICGYLVGCSGWIVRTSKSTKPRQDQEIVGNRGYIFGQPTTEPREPAFTERKVYTIEVEIPPLAKKRKTKEIAAETVEVEAEDQEAWGNKGYIFGEETQEAAEEVPEEVLEEKISAVSEQPTVEEIGALEIEKEKIIEKPIKEITRTYKVRKGDTLQKISRRFYGTTKKWPLLYKANKNKLKDPNSIHPGQVLTIPEVEEFKK